MTKRQQQIIETYRKSKSLREAAFKLGVSMQRVHQAVLKHAPDLMRPAHFHGRSARA